MYNNIGKKIKGLAIGTAIAESAAAFIGGIVLVSEDDDMIGVTVLMWLLVPVVAWVSSWLLYGFGELIEKASDIEKNTRNTDNKANLQATIDFERVQKLENLRNSGLITEEEFQQALARK